MPEPGTAELTIRPVQSIDDIHPQDWNEHLEKAHDYPCGSCGCTFITEHALGHHISRDHMEGDYCDICGMVRDRDADQWKRHLRADHKIPCRF